MERLSAIILASIIVGTPSAALSETCDIAQFKQYISYRKDIMTSLSYINQIASQEDRSKNDKADLNISDYGSFNYGQASTLSSSLESLLDVRWSQRDQEWLLISNLNEDGVKAYKLCLEGAMANLIVNLSPAASNSDEFIVDYAWRPSYTDKPVDVNIISTNATMSDLKNKIPSPSSGAFKVKRASMYKPLEMHITVDGQPYPTISLPAFPSKKLEKQIRKNAETQEVYGGGNSLTKRICVTIPNNEQDAVIVPNSVQVTIEPSISERASILQGAITYSPREACSTFVWHLEAKDGHVKGTATVQTLVLKAVDIPAASPIQVVGETAMFQNQQK